MARTKNQTLGTINWTAENNALIWRLLTQLAKKENQAALYGVQKGHKTLGSSKAKIHKEIAAALFPESYEGNEDTLGSRVKGKIEDLYGRYKKEVKKLTVTGGGLGGDDNDNSESQPPSQEEHLACYVPAEGPDETTTSHARNLWEKIIEGFPFFPEMHRHLCGRPNAIPPVVTTGVGPTGRHVVHFQAIEDRSSSSTAAELSSQLTSAPAVTPAEVLATPVRPKSSASGTKDAKENAKPPPTTGGKRAPKDSSFTVTEATVEKAKASIQRVTKKSFEDRLADATEASLKSADVRAAATFRIEKKRFLLEQLSRIDKQRDQVIELCRLKVYSDEDAKRKLNDLDKREEDIQRPAKRARARSPTPSVRHSSPIEFPSSPTRFSSPDWAIADGRSLPSQDTTL